MDRAYAEQVMREHCSIAWVVKGESIRDTTDEERYQLRAEQAKQGGVPEAGRQTCRKCKSGNVKTSKVGLCTVCEARASLANAEIPGLTCTIRPDYGLIRAAHEYCASAA